METLNTLIRKFTPILLLVVIGWMAFKNHEQTEAMKLSALKSQLDSISAAHSKELEAGRMREERLRMENAALKDSIVQAVNARRLAEAGFKNALERLQRGPDHIQQIVRELNSQHAEVISQYQAQLLASANLLLNEKNVAADLNDRVIELEHLNKNLQYKVAEASKPKRKHGTLIDIGLTLMGAAAGYSIGAFR